MLGRTLLSGDHAGGAEAVALLGHDLWKERFEASENIIGTVINVDGQPTRVVGVMPAGYEMPHSSQLWLPVPAQLLDPLENDFSAGIVEAYGFLKDSASETEADNEINNLMQRIRSQYPPDPMREYGSSFEKEISETNVGHIAQFPISQFGGLGAMFIIGVINTLTLLVFLLACINVGTLLLARTNERLRDTSIRVALGAPRFRLLVQMIGESVVITVFGTTLAILLAGAGLGVVELAFTTLNADLLAFWMTFDLDGSTLIGAMFYVLLTILLTSAIPCWRIINGDFNSVMRDGTRGAVGLKPGRFSRGLVVVSLVIVTFLVYLVTLVGSAVIPLVGNLSEVPDNMLGARFSLDEQRYSHEQRLQFIDTLFGQMSNEPSIRYALINANLGSGFVEKEGVVTAAQDRIQTSVAASGPSTPPDEAGTFVADVDETVAIQLLEGRSINQFDTAVGEKVVVISQSLATRLWEGESALDKRLKILDSPGVTDEWRRVVGVTNDNGTASFITEVALESATLPLAQVNTGAISFNAQAFATSKDNMDSAMNAIRDTINQLDSGLDVQLLNYDAMLSSVTRAFGLGVSLALTLGSFSFIVAISGIFGLTQNSVMMATQEIGTRRALGATDTMISKMFLKRGSKQVLDGFLLSMLLTAPLTFLFFLIASDLGMDTLFSIVISILVLGALYAVVLTAIYHPIRKILQMEPSEALRYE
jgi:predicted permease